MSDCLIFACLFATYGVLGRSYAAGPSGAELFDLPLVAVNTALLLLSSITYGFAMIAMQEQPQERRCMRLAGRHRPARRWPSWRSSCTSSHHLHPRGRRPAAQRVPVVVLRAGRHARAARDLRHRSGWSC